MIMRTVFITKIPLKITLKYCWVQDWKCYWSGGLVSMIWDNCLSIYILQYVHGGLISGNPELHTPRIYEVSCSASQDPQEAPSLTLWSSGLAVCELVLYRCGDVLMSWSRLWELLRVPTRFFVNKPGVSGPNEHVQESKHHREVEAA